MTAVPLAELAAFLEDALDARAFSGEPPAVFISGDRSVARLGLALEADGGCAGWADAERLDALFLHRPWGAAEAGLPAGIGVLASHAPFDHRLTIAANPDLARDLGLRDPSPFGEKDGRTIGMIGGVEPADAAKAIERIRRLFGGTDEVLPGRTGTVRRVAFAGAMTDGLIRAAAAEGADLYLTGQIRKPAVRAVAETGICVVAAGHARSEAYGLRLLAGMIERRFAGRVRCVVRGGTGPAHPPPDGHPPAPEAP
jgi:putative NIF3 family GTP cyclohydrolase 1 type 2